MNPATIEAMNRDNDLAARSRVPEGHPSQNPDPAAQVPLAPAESERESQSALVGGGVVAGAAAGAAIGTVIAGPAGSLVGGTVGLVAGGLGGAAAGQVIHPETPAEMVPKVQDPEVMRIGETRQEDLRR